MVIDCGVHVEQGADENPCWERMPGVSRASLIQDGSDIVSSSLVDITSERERADGERVVLEISYWNDRDETVTCRTLYRDDGAALRQTADQCFAVTP